MACPPLVVARRQNWTCRQRSRKIFKCPEQDPPPPQSETQISEPSTPNGAEASGSQTVAIQLRDRKKRSHQHPISSTSSSTKRRRSGSGKEISKKPKLSSSSNLRVSSQHATQCPSRWQEWDALRDNNIQGNGMLRAAQIWTSFTRATSCEESLDVLVTMTLAIGGLCGFMSLKELAAGIGQAPVLWEVFSDDRRTLVQSLDSNEHMVDFLCYLRRIALARLAKLYHESCTGNQIKKTAAITRFIETCMGVPFQRRSRQSLAVESVFLSFLRWPLGWPDLFAPWLNLLYLCRQLHLPDRFSSGRPSQKTSVVS